jgi:LPXTG-site transpeptidase (sortase) family protein
MGRFGVIYDGSQNCGSVYLTRQENIAYNIAVNTQLPVEGRAYHVSSVKTSGFKFSIFLRNFILVVSTGFIGVSLFGLIFLFWPVIYQEVRYKFVLSSQTVAEEKKFPGFPQGSQWTPSNTTFSVVVPKIEANEPIIANVDTSDEKAYTEALKKGIAQAKGTCFPGMDCTMYLFAHSAGSSIVAARYNAVFYLLNKLETGDQILIYYEGKKILYEATGKEIVGADDTKYITDVGNEERLILQTCDPPGTVNNRLLVFAKPKLVEYLK